MLVLVCILQALHAACPIKELRAQILSDEVLGKLSPLSLAQFSQTDKEYYQLARQFTIVDVEQVYNIYWSTPKEDALEIEALKRRVHCLMPPPRDLKYQSTFVAYMNALFSRRLIEGEMVATNRFPELCRMIFRHHTFARAVDIWGFDIKSSMSVLKSQWIELTLPKGNLVGGETFCVAAALADKATAIKLAGRLMEPSPFMSLILSGKSLADLLGAAAKLSLGDLCLIALLTTDQNLACSKAIFSRPEHCAQFNTYLVALIRNVHPELAQVVFERAALKELERRKLVLQMVNFGASIKVYRGLRGTALYEQCQAYLDSYSLSREKFTAQKPVRLSFRMLLEAALVMGCPDEVTLCIMRKKRSRTDEHLLVLAMAVEASKDVLYSLLERFDPERSSLAVIGREFTSPHYSKGMSIPIDRFVFDSLAGSKYHGCLNAQILLCLASAATVRPALVEQPSFRFEKRDRGCLLSTALSNLWRAPNKMAEVRALLQFAVANSFAFLAENGPYAGAVLFGEFDFFADFTVGQLLEKLPHQLADGIQEFGFSRNLSVLIIRVILARPRGFQALQGHLHCPGEFHLVMYFLRDERLSMETLALSLPGMLGSAAENQVFWMLDGSQAVKRGLTDEIVRNFDRPLMASVVGRFLSASLPVRAGMEEVPVICALTAKQLEKLFCAQPNVLKYLTWHPTSARWLHERGLIGFALKMLVLVFAVHTHADLAQNYPDLLPLLPTQDAAEIDAVIAALLQQQDENDDNLSPFKGTSE